MAQCLQIKKAIEAEHSLHIEGLSNTTNVRVIYIH